MNRSEFWITCIVSSFPLVYIILFITMDLHEITGDFSLLGVLVVFYVKEWVLADNVALKKQCSSITKRKGIYMALVILGVIVGIMLLIWLEESIGRELIIGVGMTAFLIMWLKECWDAWKKYSESNP